MRSSSDTSQKAALAVPNAAARISAIATPIMLLASSTSPIADISTLLFRTREPSTSPVVPSSPVRV